MEGYPVNTYRFVWKPLLGVHSLKLDEANLIGGVDADFHRHDIIDAIESGAYPEYELGVQLIAEKDEFKYDFDILDDTKLCPEEIVPLKMVGKMTLNRLVDNFFAEEEQAAFNPSNFVPGIEASNDPVLQGRSFAYRDTELYRQNTPNYEDLPVNRPINEVNNNLRDGHSKVQIDTDSVHYHSNSLADDTPAEVSPGEGGYENYPGKVEGHLTREHPSDSFDDHFTQARIFWNSLSKPERDDLIESFSFHLGGVKDQELRQMNIEMWANVDEEMATLIAENIRVNPPKTKQVKTEESYESLSQLNSPHSAKTQKVGVLVGQKFDDKELKKALDTLSKNGVMIEVVSEKLGPVKGKDGTELVPDKAFLNSHPALYDAIYVVGGESANQMMFDQHIHDFVRMQFMHLKPICVATGQEEFIKQKDAPGIVLAADNSDFADQFVDAIAKKRFWDRI